ncbi:DUF4169 family protein [Sphingomonas sp. LB-2]|uniref:DUF4169 family protein n=1 Tax=Sphingomonas caeni TaxID=2984949 RepID=UPI002231B3AF|nr:DUF4169 family protein [Sphingomonas caeni]MCW3846871.1 DUF4169 family protein [Sphingomonas caeni]
MAEIINLNKMRKAKAAVDKAAQAEVNRAKFGRTKAQKQAEAEEAYRRTKLLDDSKLEP